MLAFMKSVSRLENRVDTSFEKFVFHHRFWGFFMIFIGMPVVILAAVCVCTSIIALPMALLFGWM